MYGHVVAFANVCPVDDVVVHADPDDELDHLDDELDDEDGDHPNDPPPGVELGRDDGVMAIIE